MTALTLISRARFTAPSASKVFAFTVPYLSSTHIEGYINGVQDPAITVGATTVTFNDTVATSDHILIKRVTPRTLATQLVDFTNGAPAVESDFDTLQAQLLYLIQETQDDALESAANKEADGNLTAGSRIIEDLVDGVSAQDAVTKAQLDNVQTTGGNLPSVTGSDNDSGVAVVAGAWATRTAAQMRAHFALLSASLLDAGASAGEVPILDANALVPIDNARQVKGFIELDGDFLIDQDSDSGAAWLTESTGSNYRVDIAAHTSVYDPDGLITSDGATNSFTLGAGVWLFEVDIAFVNDSAISIIQPEWAITDTDGTTVHFGPFGGATQPIAPNSGVGYTYRTVRFVSTLDLSGSATLFWRMRNEGGVATGQALTEGSRITLTRIGA